MESVIFLFLQLRKTQISVFHWVDHTPRCCHIHISNPYSEMTQQDIWFPTQIGRYTSEYLNKCIDEYKRTIEEQTKFLEKLSFEDSLTGLFNRNKFNFDMKNYEKLSLSKLGVAAIDLNGLKPVNDHMGHSAGDNLICRTADHIASMFEGKCYRIGGDEFAVIDLELDEEAFQNAIAETKKKIEPAAIRSRLFFSLPHRIVFMQKFTVFSFISPMHFLTERTKNHYFRLTKKLP